ncbi:hypothetical protein T01_4526 [Trichinella spiralis]|uniref:Uncharacterized protein n=1 Tax=Trichinella spiralis TaxID=6334 RepID=A0A0V1AJU2_TRISP|nr:hypothetical protein T01_4526 [Trichinella spiralis]
MWFYSTILQYITIGAVHCFLSAFEHRNTFLILPECSLKMFLVRKRI